MCVCAEMRSRKAGVVGSARQLVVWDLFSGGVLCWGGRKERRTGVRLGQKLVYHPRPFALSLHSVWGRNAGWAIVVDVMGCKCLMPGKMEGVNDG